VQALKVLLWTLLLALLLTTSAFVVASLHPEAVNKGFSPAGAAISACFAAFVAAAIDHLEQVY
jgi:hypothetical protein